MLSKGKIQFLRNLQQKKFRYAESLYLAEGIKIVNEAISNYPHLISELIYTQAACEFLVPHANLTPIITSADQIARVSALKNPQEAIVVLKMQDSISENLADIKFDLALALDSVRDPGNLGTIIRLVDWFGIDSIFCSEDCVDCYNPKVVQATMGAIFRVKLYYTQLPAIFSTFAASNINIYGATLDGEDLYSSNIKFPAILVMGNESEGISSEINKMLSQKLFIPRFGNAQISSESLNVSAATSVLLSEFRRKQNYSK